MTPPYRTRDVATQAQAPRDSGIVGDIIDQFADRFAFFRELVQNAIDADTAEIAVRATHSSGSQIMTVSVSDAGVGMPRDVIENNLLVLFRSTKEDDETKIGKFGVGFASVLAIAPRLVRVTSAFGGERHTLHLFRDLSYELFDTGNTNRTGTTVELELDLKSDEVDGFFETSREALVRWCRHSSVPIHFTAEADGREPTRFRIDRPLALENAIGAVSFTSPDGKLRAIVGIPDDGSPYAGFFNHGLMLVETGEDLIGTLSFKIQDDRLGHTLSRDNVRRDAAFDRALEFVRQLADRSLRDSVTVAVTDAAASDDVDEFAFVAAAVKASEMRPRYWTFPLIEPLGERTTASGSEVGAGGWRGASQRSSITALLAERGEPVVDRRRLDPVEHLFASLSDCSLLTLATPAKDSPTLDELRRRTGDIVDKAYRSTSQLVFAEFEGHLAHRSFVTCPPLSSATFRSAFFLDRTQADNSPFAFFRRRAIAINTQKADIAALIGHENLALAAEVLARRILLAFGALSVGRSTTLLELGAEE